MNKQKVLLNFSTYKQANLLMKGRVVYQCLKSNHHFPGFGEMVDQLQTAVNAFQKEVIRRTSKENKDASRKNLVTMLTTIGRMVEKDSNGNAAKILSAGFDLVKKKPVRPLGPAKYFRVKHMGEGEMELRCQPNKNADHYLWEYRQVDGLRWVQETTGAAKLLLKGLERGKEYLFRVMQVGKHELRSYSREIKNFVV